MGRSNLFHALQRFDPALGLAGFGGFCFKTIDETLDLGNSCLLALIPGLLLGNALTALGFK